ncbi:MAG: hypothetical protein RL701_780, partial [Pseudomonadota bacterium]
DVIRMISPLSLLGKAMRYRFPNRASASQKTFLKLFLCAPRGRVVALDARRTFVCSPLRNVSPVFGGVPK